MKAGQSCPRWSARQLLPGPLLLCFINNAAQRRVGRELHRQLDRRSLQHIAAGGVGAGGAVRSVCVCGGSDAALTLWLLKAEGLHVLFRQEGRRGGCWVQPGDSLVFGGRLTASSFVIGEAGQIPVAFTVVHFTRGSPNAFQASIYIFSASLGWLCMFFVRVDGCV